ncbi:MAG: hypothetical protein BGO86_03560 [Chryseobacterium sp. 36-9]|nr:MAG: hypothetical protein BGO86_03560 [Chryseobacterium sp. 36-9]
MGILQQRGIKLVKKNFEAKIIKYADTTDWDMIHVSHIRSPEILNEIIENLDLAIAGRFNEIDNNGVTNSQDSIAFIEPNGIEYWNQDAQNLYPFTCSLQDFRELFIEWRNFLRS